MNYKDSLDTSRVQQATQRYQKDLKGELPNVERRETHKLMERLEQLIGVELVSRLGIEAYISDGARPLYKVGYNGSDPNRLDHVSLEGATVYAEFYRNEFRYTVSVDENWSSERWIVTCQQITGLDEEGKWRKKHEWQKQVRPEELRDTIMQERASP